MELVLLIPGACVGGLAFRLRGSAIFHEWTGRGATSARVVYGTALALVALLAGTPLLWSLAVIVAAWLGAIAPWWGSLTLRTPKMWLMHTLRGFLWTLPLAAVLFLAGAPHWWIMLLAGGLCAPAYKFGWMISSKLGVEFGEVIFGAIIGAALVAAL